MKIFLAYKCHDLGKMEFYSRFTPLGLGSIGAVLRREGFDATVVNMSAWSWARIARYLESERPDLLGVSTFTFNRHEAMRVARLARRARPGCLIVAGGPHATHLPHHLLERYPAIDLVVRGEGEMVLLDLARALRDGALPARLPDIAGISWRAAGLPACGAAVGRAVGPAVGPAMIPAAAGGCLDSSERAVIQDLDSLPHPCADPRTVGVDAVSQFEFIITSRGCPAACTFCSSPEFWGRGLRFRSATHMVEEVRLLRERHGVVYVSVRDDTFTVHKKRVIDFCRGLIDARLDLLWDCQSRVNAVDEERLAWMRRAGCTHIQYGVESGSPRMLQRLNKGITVEQIRAAAAATRRVGLGLSIYLITGIDSETDADLESTIRLVEAIRPHDGLVSPLTVYPGTAQYEEAKQRFGLDDEFWVRDRREAYFVREDPWTRRAVRRLQATLRRVGRTAAYGRDDFAGHRAVVGDCYALRLAMGEFHDRRGAWGAARADYEAILRDDPRSLWARMRLGALARRRGRHEEAARHYRAAVDSVSRFHLAHSLLGEALLRQRRRPEAAAAFERAHALYPADPEVRRILKRLAPPVAGSGGATAVQRSQSGR